MSDPMTESQGRKIIGLLEEVVSALEEVSSELRDINNRGVQRLDGIDNHLREVNLNLGGIATDVSRIESKD